MDAVLGVPLLHFEVGLLTLLPTDFLVNMSASADVLAQAKVEIDLSAIPLGKNVRRMNQHS